MHNPRLSDLTSVRDALLSAAITGEVPREVSFSRTLIPNPDHLVPPGYYVSSTGEAGPCAHCGAARDEHLGAVQYCPLPPLEFRLLPERAA